MRKSVSYFMLFRRPEQFLKRTTVSRTSNLGAQIKVVQHELIGCCVEGVANQDPKVMKQISWKKYPMNLFVVFKNLPENCSTVGAKNTKSNK